MNVNREVIDLLDSDDDASLSSVSFVINRKPVAQSRPRFFNGGIGDKKKPQRKLFQQDIRDQLAVLGNNPCPFLCHVPLSVTIRFYGRRPDSDFKSSRRGVGRLRSIAASISAPPIGSDVDNLAKFALDAMNKIVGGTWAKGPV